MSVDLNSQTQQHERSDERSDELLANYGGWQELEEVAKSQPNHVTTSSTQALPLLDESDHITPDQIHGERPWWMSGAPRAIVVTSSIVGLLYVLFSMFGLWGDRPQPSSSLASIDPATIDLEATARIKQLQAENENLKRAQVMGEPLPQRASNSQQVKPVTGERQPKVAHTPPPPRRIYVTAAPVSASRPTYTPHLISAAKPPSAVEAQPKKDDQPKLDPMSQWAAASNIGIWGSSSPTTSLATSNSVSATNDEPALPQSNNSSWQIKGGSGPVPDRISIQSQIPPPIERTQSIAPQTAIANRPVDGEINNLEPGANLPPNNSSFGERKLVVGTSVEGKLQTDIRWSSDPLKRKIPIQIKQPLLDVNGLEVFPKGTLLVARIEQSSKEGAVMMSIAAAITPKGFEQALPPQAILVLDKNGDEVLQAETKQRNRRGDSFGKLVLSGISGATGEIDSAIGRNAARTAVQQALNRSSQRQNLDFDHTSFVLKQGTSVRLYVNQSISLE